LNEDSARLLWPHAARKPLKQANVNDVFEFVQGLGQRRLADPERCGSPKNAPLRENRIRSPEMMELETARDAACVQSKRISETPAVLVGPIAMDATLLRALLAPRESAQVIFQKPRALRRP
jgi:hypothetical protein